VIWVVNKEAAFDRLILLFNVKEERERESRLVGNIGIAAKVLKESMILLMLILEIIRI
jgi:hypothetical protein